MARLALLLDGRALHDATAMGRALWALVDAVATINVALLGEVPPLYRSGVRYRREPSGVESLVTAPVVYRRGHGDCGHLVAWRLAELRRAGERVTPRFTWRGRAYHVVIRRADGTVEDPSLLLGMS